eukprot:scaffold461_cov321-Pavlova_lutheri.AAC.20
MARMREERTKENMRCGTCRTQLWLEEREDECRDEASAPGEAGGNWPRTEEEARQLHVSLDDRNAFPDRDGDEGTLEACLVRMLDVAEEDGDAKRKALEDVFQRASDEANLDFPICTSCASKMEQELDQRIADAQLEADMYRESIQILQHEEEIARGRPVRELEEELDKSQEQEEHSRSKLAKIEAELAEATSCMEELNARVQELETAEECYWQEYNDYKMKLHFHLEDKDALMHRIEIANAQLKLLQRSNVYNDVFNIWHEGAFGTINGYRMGSMPNIPVEWEEINAGWGQCVFLLHTMAKTSQLGFSTYKLLPMGSFPRIADGKVTYELFGPVNLLNPFGGASKYDKGAVAFLSCLQEFADYAYAKDKAAGERSPFRLPFCIEGEKIGGKSIRYSFNREEKWTAALKLLLANLKVGLAWFIKNFGELEPTGDNLLRS